MATDTSGSQGAPTTSRDLSAGDRAWQAVQLGAQPLWQTIHQWTVAAILIGCICLGCYTLLLTWPLTQTDAHVDYQGRCEEAANDLLWYDRQIYAMVLEPCQDGDTELSPADRQAQEREAAELAAQEAGAEERAEIEASGDAVSPVAVDEAGATADGVVSATEPIPAPNADEPSTGEGEADAGTAPPTSNDGAVEQAKPTKPLDGNAGQTAESQVKSSSASRQPNALFVAVLAAGLTGGAVYSLRSHTIHVARHTHDPSWGLWNLTRPFLGAALAVFLFFLIRAGFVQNTGGGSGALRPEGFIALGGLVGLFSDQAWARMRIVAESIFSPRDSDTSAADRPGPAPGPSGGSDMNPPAPDPTPTQGGEGGPSDGRPQG